MIDRDNVFVGCDWGSTSFRLRIVEFDSRRVQADQHTSDGIRKFSAAPTRARTEAMARFFSERLAAWPDLPAAAPIVISGMASSNVGWLELPYAEAPFPLDGTGCRTGRVSFPVADGSIRTALLISGVRTADDIMRGEECALIGGNILHASAAQRGAATVALLAGTHPKHALLRDGVLVSFRTHLTGELFDALAGSGLLATSLDRAAANDSPDFESFRAGVGCTRELGVSAALFQVRARAVLRGATKPANTWFLSGLLVGAELERLGAVNAVRELGASEGGAASPPNLASSADEVAPSDAGVAELFGNPLAKTTRLLLIGEPRRVALYRAALDELRLTRGGVMPAAIDLTDAIVAGQELVLRRHNNTRNPSAPLSP